MLPIVLAPHIKSLFTALPPYECQHDNADVEQEEPKKSSHTVAPLLMRGVEVDWKNRVLVDISSVQDCIEELLETHSEI